VLIESTSGVNRSENDAREIVAYLYRQIRLYFRLQLPSTSLLAEYVHFASFAASTQSAQFVVVHFAISGHTFPLSRGKHGYTAGRRKTIAQEERRLAEAASIRMQNTTAATASAFTAAVVAPPHQHAAAATTILLLDIHGCRSASSTNLRRIRVIRQYRSLLISYWLFTCSLSSARNDRCSIFRTDEDSFTASSCCTSEQ